MLKCILGLIVPSQGSISIYGESINGHNVWKKRHHLAYVAQEPDLGTETVREVIEKPFNYLANLTLRDNLGRLPGLMEQFNLSQSLLDKSISTLSGGEKQRIALVTAILLDRSIVLLDEVSSALDKKNKQAVANYFQQNKNITILSVAHDIKWLGFTTNIVDMLEQNSVFGANK